MDKLIKKIYMHIYIHNRNSAFEKKEILYYVMTLVKLEDIPKLNKPVTGQTVHNFSSIRVAKIVKVMLLDKDGGRECEDLLSKGHKVSTVQDE